MSAPDPTTCAESDEHVDYPKCDLCGQRAPSPEFLERHRIRRCPGPVGARPFLRLPRKWRAR